MKYWPKYRMRNWINLIENDLHDVYYKVYDICEKFVSIVERDQTANEVYADDKGGYLHVFIGGYAGDGFNEAKGKEYAQQLNALVEPFDWFISKCNFKWYNNFQDDPDMHEEGDEPQLMCFIDVFPQLGEEVNVPPTVYHISPIENHQTILTTGLKPMTGGNDHITTVNGRVYVFFDHDDFPFIAKDMKNLRGWEDFDLYKINSNCSEHWYEDVEVPKTCAWTPDHIPSSAIQFVRRYTMEEAEDY